MNNIIELIDNIKDDINNIDSEYTYNGTTVPRVTKIISRCIHNDSLMYWANSLGFKHQSYAKVINAAAQIGTEVHNNIDMYLEDNTHIISDTIDICVINAYLSFLKWYSTIVKLAKVEVIFHEKALSCKYFGGTLDGLYKINDMVYLVDYKTSNNITFNYYLQLAAYRYLLKMELGIDINGIIILQLNKNNVSYNEYVLDFNNNDHLNFINHCERCFLSLLYSYYNISIVENEYNNLYKGR